MEKPFLEVLLVDMSSKKRKTKAILSKNLFNLNITCLRKTGDLLTFLHRINCQTILKIKVSVKHMKKLKE